jgi:hypothetical protein
MSKSKRKRRQRLHIDDQTHADLGRHCQARGVSMSGYTRQAIYDAIERDEMREKQQAAPKNPWERAPFWQHETGEKGGRDR